MNGEQRTRTWLRTFLGALAILGVLWVFYSAREIVVLLVFAIFLAYALNPLVDALERARLPLTKVRIGRPVSSGLVVLGIVVLLFLAFYRAVPVAISELNKIIQDLPDYVSRLQEWGTKIEARYGGRLPISFWLASLEAELGRLSVQSGKYIGKGLFAAVSVVVRLIGLILVPVATFYVLNDGKKFRRGLMGIIPHARRDRAERVLGDVDAALASYVRGLAAVCTFMAASSVIAFTLVGLNYSLILGLLAGFCEVLPFVGFVIVSVVVVLVGLFESPWMALKGFLVYLALNQFLSYVVSPRLMARRMKLHPLTVLVSIMVGAKLAGITGVLLALPAVSVGKVLFLHLVVGSSPSEAPEPDR